MMTAVANLFPSTAFIDLDEAIELTLAGLDAVYADGSEQPILFRELVGS